MTPAEVLAAVFPAADCDADPSQYRCQRPDGWGDYMPGMHVRCYHRRPGGLGVTS